MTRKMITYHKAKLEEAAEIKNLLFETWTSTYLAIYSIDAIRTVTAQWHSIKLLTKQILNPDICFLVAKDGNKIVGMCNGLYNRKDKRLNIQRLHVLPNYQGRGIGSVLFNKVSLAFGGLQKIELEVEKKNLKAITFYEKHGFKIKRKKVFEIQGVRMPCLVMEREIINN